MIKIKDLNFSYGDTKIIDSLSLEIPGSAVITGPSGSGKSTLLKLIGGILTPDSGKISQAAGRLSFMFQEDRLLPWLSVRDNVAAVSDAETAVKMLEKVGILHLADKQIRDISGGEQRRCALARALAFDADMLLLDEPFTGLDEPLAAKAASVILETGKTFIAVIHSSFELNTLGAGIQNIRLPL